MKRNFQSLIREESFFKMASANIYDIFLHYGNQEFKLTNFDPDGNCYIDFLPDLCETLFKNQTEVHRKPRLNGKRIARMNYENQIANNDRVHASPMPDGITFKIKTRYPDHTCVRSEKTKASSKWMAKMIVHILRGDPNVRPQLLKDELIKHGMSTSEMQLFRAKKAAMEMIDDNDAQSYCLLPKIFQKGPKRDKTTRSKKAKVYADFETENSMESSAPLVMEFQKTKTQQFAISQDINKMKDKVSCNNSQDKSPRVSMLLGNNFPGVISAAIPSSNASQAVPTTESSTSATTSTVAASIPSEIDTFCCFASISLGKLLLHKKKQEDICPNLLRSFSAFR
ncbi:hypothetical protein M9H77_17781 [Catharanthus roseus]|uniref:Uncharacterized protein n=1 Tax=Catharanthus roseus TaxID=4058 RepID=A0ACC0B5X4_CATRO|nr:hypothetical protein M9H77_17781 [Catharanthus roseus]